MALFISRGIAIQFISLARPIKTPKQTTIKSQPQIKPTNQQKIQKTPTKPKPSSTSGQDCSYKENHKEAGKHHNQLKAWEIGIKKYILEK